MTRIENRPRTTFSTRYLPVRNGNRTCLEQRDLVATEWRCAECGTPIPDEALLIAREIESRWTRARDQFGEVNDRRTPSPGMAALLLSLREDGHAHGGELARRTHQAQGNVAGSYLPRLERFGFIEWIKEVRLGHQGGGNPSRIWRLTKSGRELAALLRDASEHAHECTAEHVA